MLYVCPKIKFIIIIFHAQQCKIPRAKTLSAYYYYYLPLGVKIPSVKSKVKSKPKSWSGHSSSLEKLLLLLLLLLLLMPLGSLLSFITTSVHRDRTGYIVTSQLLAEQVLFFKNEKSHVRYRGLFITR